MGSDARVYVFDHERYVREVVPVVHEWLRTLHLDDPLDATFVAYQSDDGLQPTPGTDLAAHSTTLGADLRFVGEPNAGHAWFDGWEPRRCRSETCPSRATCPWHQERFNVGQVANDLIEWLVVKNACLGDRAFVGRTTTVGNYAELLDAVGHPAGSRLRELLDALGSRGRVIGYQWQSYGEGIHGWLDADEATELVAELDTLDLPNVGATVDDLDANLRASFGATDPPPFEQWSLAVVRAIARLARDARR